MGGCPGYLKKKSLISCKIKLFSVFNRDAFLGMEFAVPMNEDGRMGGDEKLVSVRTPLSDEIISSLKIRDFIEISGKIYAGRDAALPKLVKLYRENGLQGQGLDLAGGVIFHTAVSLAGVGPTSSNKLDIESSIPDLSAAGIKIHLGKGTLQPQTVEALKQHNSIFAITPPVSSLLTSKIKSCRVAAFAEEGIEALYELDMENIPAIVAVAHGSSIFRY